MENQVTKNNLDRLKFSILVPVYNEEDTIDAFFKRIDPVIQEIENQFNLDVEVIFTDNASEDQTFEKLLNHAKSRPYVKLYRFSRNFGFQRSILSGYSLTNGAACVQIDCDLEDPPELIIKFIEKWLEGYKIVYGIRKKRMESKSLHYARTVFYKVINLLSEINIPEHAGDFRLIDRRVINIICQVNDAEPYLRGLIGSLGFKQMGIEYDRSARVAGTSSFSISSYLSLATEGIVQSSIKPLNISLYMSAIVMVVSAMMAIYYIYGTIFGDYPPEARGFATIVVLGLFQFSFLLFVIGLNSLYLGRVYRQVFKRPISIIDKSNVEVKLDEKIPTYWPSEPYKSTEDEQFLDNIGKRHNKDASDGS